MVYRTILLLRMHKVVWYYSVVSPGRGRRTREEVGGWWMDQTVFTMYRMMAGWRGAPARWPRQQEVNARMKLPPRRKRELNFFFHNSELSRGIALAECSISPTCLESAWFTYNEVIPCLLSCLQTDCLS